MRDIELHFDIHYTNYKIHISHASWTEILNLDMRLFCQYLFQLLKNRRSSAIVLRNNDR